MPQYEIETSKLSNLLNFVQGAQSDLLVGAAIGAFLDEMDEKAYGRVDRKPSRVNVVHKFSTLRETETRRAS